MKYGIVDIIDTAFQLILVHRKGKDLEGFVVDLENALTSYGIIEDNQLTVTP